MKMNRVQFQPGLSMAEFFDRYGSNDKCEASVIASRWPEGFVCPACGAGPHSSFRRQGRLYFQCSACRHQCSVLSGKSNQDQATCLKEAGAARDAANQGQS